MIGKIQWQLTRNKLKKEPRTIGPTKPATFEGGKPDIIAKYGLTT